MEQYFNDQLLRLERDRKAREVQVEELEKRLSDERADSEKRLQEALAESSRVIQDLNKRMDEVRQEDRSQYQDTINTVRSQQRNAKQECQQWKREAERLNTQIQAATIGSFTSDSIEKKRLEQRIADLERERQQNSTNFWDVLVPIATVASSVLLRTLL